jgi:hypothetical protein
VASRHLAFRLAGISTRPPARAAERALVVRSATRSRSLLRIALVVSLATQRADVFELRYGCGVLRS